MPKPDVQDVKQEGGDIQTPQGDGGSSAPTQDAPSTSPEVKTGESNDQQVDTNTGSSEKSVDELQAQINNLNIALKQEREAKKEDKTKIEELTAKLDEATETMSKLKNAFLDDEGDSQTTEELPPAGLTREELDAWWEEKEQEREAKLQEQKRSELIQQEIKELEKTYDGTDGKPKYDDNEILQWQKENDKLHLSPGEAFREMKYKEILDYELRKRQEGTPPAGDGEQPPSAPSVHEPNQTPQILDEQQTRKAVEEAIENAAKEM